MSGFTDFLSNLGSSISGYAKKKLDPKTAQELLRGNDDDLLGLEEPEVSDLDISKKSTGMFGGVTPEALTPMGNRSIIQGIVPGGQTDRSDSKALVTTPHQQASDSTLPGIPSLETALGFKQPGKWTSGLTAAANVFLPSLAKGIAYAKSGRYGGFGAGMAEGVGEAFPAELNRQAASESNRRSELRKATSDPYTVAAYNRARARAEGGDAMFSSGQKNFNDLMNEEIAKIRQQQADSDIAHKMYGTTGWGLVQRLEDEGRHAEAEQLRQNIMQSSARGDLGMMLAMGGGGGDILETIKKIQDVKNRSRTENAPVTEAQRAQKYQEAVERVLKGQKQPGDAELISAYEQEQAQGPSRRRGGGSVNSRLLHQ